MQPLNIQLPHNQMKKMTLSTRFGSTEAAKQLIKKVNKKQENKQIPNITRNL